MSSRPAVPQLLTRAPLRTVRPKDARTVYRAPRSEFARLSRAGALLRVAPGYYVVVPDDRGADWRPSVEAAAAGVAASIFGPGEAVLMGMSAARVLGAVPRALGVAVVAAPRQHRPVRLDGLGGPPVFFVKRDVARLDARSEGLGETGRGLVTTPEQTVLDLARPLKTHVSDEQVAEAIRNLAPRCDKDVLQELARDQRLGRALDRVLEASG